MVGVRQGLVRIREHKRHVSVQFAAQTSRVESVFRAVATALTGLVHPDERLVIDNLLTGESKAITLGGLQAEMGQ
jgi:hypothetical protein